MQRLRVAWSLSCLLLSSPLLAGNAIEIENLRPGTVEWRLKDPAFAGEIEAYPSSTSVDRGETIRIFVNTASPEYSIEFFRLGWYGGAGGRRMTDPVTRPGIVQEIPAPDAITGLVDCAWRDPYEIAVPESWTSGVYVAKLTARPLRKQIYTSFVVRDDAAASKFLFQSAVSTFQAYNPWGGKSLYSHNSADRKPARKVSFNRPYHPEQGLGAGKFLNNGGWEYNMVRWLERHGYDVTYCTDVDVHRDPMLVRRHNAFLSVGHDEYWSHARRAHVEAARDAGVHLGFFGANACYWQIRLEPSARTGESDRIVVGYKSSAATEDPLAVDGDPSNDHLVTRLWREIRPESQLVGQMYVSDGVDADFVVERSQHWVFRGTGLSDGDRIPLLMGYEVDQISPGSPWNVERLARSPFERRGVAMHADTTIYRAPAGGWVFATGTIQWSWGLDDFNVPDGRTSRVHPAVDRITRNVLAAFAGGPARRRGVRAAGMP